mmetsp:Transcript_16782/g.41017  ORF Transcript_16782/g.41017 Transcript_16782/m.41017 type:complete len:279 (+) Transcript_16782:301-1137(+)
MITTPLVKKSLYFEKLVYLFSKYPRILIVQADNVGSNQIQKCRKSLKDNSILIMGKNSIIKKVLRKQIEKNSSFEEFYTHTSGNVGLIFTKLDPFQIQKILKDNKIPAAARIGQIAQHDVIIPAGPTEISPDGTSFFQALNIPTKIQRGQIEILDPVKIIEKGKIVGSSEAALLKKLNLVPFSFELEIRQIFDTHTCYDPSFLEITSEKLIYVTKEVVSDLNFISLSIQFPTYSLFKNSVQEIFSILILLGTNIGYSFSNLLSNVNIDLEAVSKKGRS